MKFKVNIKARLQRHARNSHVFQKSHVLRVLTTFKIVACALVIILPIYPSFAFMSGITESSVGAYDNSTIIAAYDDESEEDALYSQESGFLRPGWNVSFGRDTNGMNELISYQVEAGDSFAWIAEKFNISVNSVIWANGMTKWSVLKPGMIIKIPPVSGLAYKVQAGETITAIADKFKVSADKIREQNRLVAGQELLLGQDLLIPGAIRIANPSKDTPAQVVASAEWAKSAANAAKQPAKTTVNTPPKTASKKPAGKPAKDSYLVRYNGNSKGFAWGNCTYYVATHKNVTWRGNANQWLRNAAAAGVATGNKPAQWAIISLAGRGYNPYYGHVGIVVDIDGDDLIIKDMNYRRLNEVTVRRIAKTDSAIRGYIYTD